MKKSQFTDIDGDVIKPIKKKIKSKFELPGTDDDNEIERRLRKKTRNKK